MTLPALPTQGSTDWYPWAAGVDDKARAVDTLGERIDQIEAVGTAFTSTLTRVYQTAVTTQPAAGQRVVTLDSTASLAPGWTVVLGADTNIAERRAVASVSGNEVTLTADITGAWGPAGLVIYSNQPLDVDYLTAATYQQVTGGKDFRGPLRYQRPVPANPGVEAYDGLDLINAIITSRAQGGGGIVAKAAGDQTAGVIDWIHAGTTQNSGYLFHLTHAQGTSLGTLMGIGVQGNGGGGILIAKDGPKGAGIIVDQKGVVTDPTAYGIFISQASRFSDSLRFQQVQPGAAPTFNLLTSGHTPWPEQLLSQWQGITPHNIFGWVDALKGELLWQQTITADATKNNTAAALRFRGRGGGLAAVIDSGGAFGGGPFDSGPALRLFSFTGVQQYSGQLRMSKTAQAMQIAVGNGASRLGAESMSTVFEAAATAIRTIGVDQQSTPLVVPSGVTVTVAGTPGATTYGYRVAAVNAKGVTVASTTATTATGPATLTTTDRVTVSWSAVPGASAYRVYGRTSGAEALLAVVGQPSRTITGKVYAAHTRTVTDVVTTGNASNITSATAAFTADDISRRIQIPGQGYNGNDLDQTIIAVPNATTATLNYSPNSSATGVTATISAPALTLLDATAGTFTSADIGKAVQIPGAAAGGGILYATIEQWISSTRVVLDATPALSLTGATVTISGGTPPLSFVDNGAATPAGGLPGAPVGQTARVTPWTSQNADVAQWQDNSAAPVTTQRINRNGRHIFRVSTAPALSDLADGEATLWTDTDGALRVTVRVAGVLKSGSVTVA